MRRTRRWLVLGALVSALGLAAAACGGGGTNVSSGAGFLGNVSGSANTANSGTPAKGGTVTHTIEKNITNWNPETADGNTFDFIQVLNMIYPNLFLYLPDVSVKLNTDILVSATQTNTSPETIVYKIQPNAVWSDGVPINADVPQKAVPG